MRNQPSHRQHCPFLSSHWLGTPSRRGNGCARFPSATFAAFSRSPRAAGPGTVVKSLSRRRLCALELTLAIDGLSRNILATNPVGPIRLPVRPGVLGLRVEEVRDHPGV